MNAVAISKHMMLGHAKIELERERYARGRIDRATFDERVEEVCKELEREIATFRSRTKEPNRYNTRNGSPHSRQIRIREC